MIDLSRHFTQTVFALGLWFALGALPCLATATINQQVDPPEAHVGDEITVTITVQNGSASNIRLPSVEGLQTIGTSTATNITFNNGALSSAVSKGFHLVASHAGDFTIPAFDINLQDGGTLHAQAMKIHVVDNANAPPSLAPSSSNPPINVPAVPTFNPNGPVVMPPNNGQGPDTQADSGNTSATNISVPVEKDGRPAKVFIVITPQTTDAYVGESIPMRIEFFLRLDVAAQQDSLPTIKGSSFLMNSLSVHFQQDEIALMNEAYHHETWVTAISAPKSGDFPLQMERDTYWTKPNSNNLPDPINSLFYGHSDLVHQMIGSNQLTIHVHELPQEGRPANFTGAIGQLKVDGSALPQSVAVGEPVTLHFTVSGTGNFDYVRCPSLANDPAWKTYVPSSKIEYQDESHTVGTKTFEQAIIPQKNGTLPIPQASFSYFDPNTKQYVSLPVPLPDVTVTGSAISAATSPAASADANAVAAPQASELLPNRLAVGSLQAELWPAYRQSWFWVVQGGLLSALALCTILGFLRRGSGTTDEQAEREKQQRMSSLHQEENAMSEAVRTGNAQAFFLAARHVIQLQLGEQWKLRPETITLAEIRQHDPQLATTLEPLFTQSDEVIYSGRTSSELDLAQWERHVLNLLQPA